MSYKNKLINKTLKNKLINKTLLSLLVILSFSFFSNTAFAASGIKYAFYEVLWCSPHYKEENFKNWDSFSKKCQKWNFIKKDNVWVLTYKWGNNFTSWDVEINEFPGYENASDDVNFFKDIDSIRIDWEWVYTLKILLVDHAYNTFMHEYVYKIDKTAPQFKLNWFEEENAFIYVPQISDIRISSLSWKVSKFDSNLTWSIDEIYANPEINNYFWETPTKYSDHTRENLYILYYKDNDMSQKIKIIFDFDDSYNNFLDNWTEDDWKNWDEMISWIYKFTLIKPDWKEKDILSYPFNWEQTSSLYEWNDFDINLEIDTGFFDWQAENSQDKYKLRAYDKAWNYSETIFYVVRDNTKPNMWENWLAWTENDAINELLKFNNTTTVWDTNIRDKNVSKIFTADNINLISKISDIWIKWDWTTNYNLFNAWLTNHYEFLIENNDDKNDKIKLDFNFNNRFINNKTKNKNFTIIDSDRENGYRKYSTEFKTKWPSLSWICDLVWNCLEPELDFRVVANKLDQEKSTITINAPEKIFADWNDSYKIKTILKDKYWNNIVWVKAIENWNQIVKKVENTYTFENWLNYNQIENNWTKWVLINDLESDNDEFNNKINIWLKSLNFKEKIEWTPKNWSWWIYSFDITSKVPTYWVYNYLSTGSILKLNKIKPKAEVWDITNTWIYPDRDDWLWLFNETIILSWTNNFITWNTKLFDNWDYTTDIDESKENEYWKVTKIDNTDIAFNTLNNRKLNFEFSAPLIVSWSWFTINHLINNIWQSDFHTKKAYTFWKTENITNWKFYDKYLPSYTWATVNPKPFTPNVFNIKKWESDDTWNTINDLENININLLTHWSWKNYKIKSTPIQENYQIQDYVFNMWYSSYLTYNIWTEQIKIPSISRNLSANPNNLNYSKEKWSLFFFNNNYNITQDAIINTGIAGSMWLALTWISNSVNTMITDNTQWTKANVDLSNKITKYNWIITFKQNVQLRSAWITWCKSNDFGWTIWENELNNISSNLLENCTINKYWESISFIEWNLDISCNSSGNNICDLDNNLRRSIIVKNWSTYIKSDISKKSNNWKLLLWTLAYWLKNVNIPTSDNPKINRDENVNGWTFIDTEVTNISAYIVNEWPVISWYWDINEITLYNTPDSLQLKNQLHIYWSLMSLNKIWWYKSAGASECPYIIGNYCDSKTAFIFDLVTLRRYSLEWKEAWSLDLIPSGWWFRSWRNNSVLKATQDTNNIINSIQVDTSWKYWLRFINDENYIIYPLFIEKDTSWKIKPSILFEN